MSADVYQRYFHIFWIPCFPLAKTVATECSHCKQVKEGKEVPEDQRPALVEARRNARTPIWMFSGVIVGILLFAVLYVIGSLVQREEQQATAEYLTSPQSGDLYVVDLIDALGIGEKTHRYGVLRLVAVEGDDLTFVVGNFGYAYSNEVTSAIRSNEIAADAYFSEDEPVVLGIADAQALHQNDDVLVIVRK